MQCASGPDKRSLHPGMVVTSCMVALVLKKVLFQCKLQHLHNSTDQR